MSKDFEQLRAIQSQLTPLETLAAKKDSQAARAAERIADPTSTISTIRRSAFILENIGPRQAQIIAELEAIRSAKAAEVSAMEKEVDSLAPYEHIPSVRAAIERVQAELDLYRTPVQVTETESAEITLIENLPALPTPPITEVTEPTTVVTPSSPIEEPSDEKTDVRSDLNDIQTDLATESTDRPLDEPATLDLPAAVTNTDDSADTAIEPDDSSKDVHDSEPDLPSDEPESDSALVPDADSTPITPEMPVKAKRTYTRRASVAEGRPGDKRDYVLPTGEKIELTNLRVTLLSYLEKNGIMTINDLSDKLLKGHTDTEKSITSRHISNINQILASYNLQIVNLTSPSDRNKGKVSEYGLFYWTETPEDAIKRTVLEESTDLSIFTDFEAVHTARILTRPEIVSELKAIGISLFDDEWVKLAHEIYDGTNAKPLTSKEMDQMKENVIRKIQIMITEGTYTEVAARSGKSAENILTYIAVEFDGKIEEAFGIILKHLEADRKRPKGRNAVRATMVAGGVYHVAIGNDTQAPPAAAIHRFTKEPIAHEPDEYPTVAPKALESISAVAATPEEPITPEPTDAPAENEDDVIGAHLTQAGVSEVPAVAVIDIPAPQVAVETKKEQNKEPRPDLFDKDPEYAARIETALTQILATFTDLDRDARLQIAGRQVTGAGDFRIAFKNKAESSGYIVVLGSKSKELYTTEALVMLSYLKEHHPKFNFSPAAKRQLRDYIRARVEDLIISQQLIKKERNENKNGGGK